MTPENFCYWLQGYFEIGKEDSLTEQQIEEIKRHLKLVFLELTPYVTMNYSNGAHISKEMLDKLKTYRTQPTFTC